MKLGKKQREAKDWALNNESPIVMIAGEGGTGKSHILLDIARELGATRVNIGAYTHAAKNRLQKELDETLHVRTVASLMGKEIKINMSATNINDMLFTDASTDIYKDENIILLLDECSMVGQEDMQLLMNKYSKIIAFGDVVQLPPVNAQAFDWDSVPTIVLKKNYRTGKAKKLLGRIRENRLTPDVSHHKHSPEYKIETLLKKCNKKGKSVRIIAHKNEDVTRFNDKYAQKYGDGSIITHRNNVTKKIKLANGELIVHNIYNGDTFEKGTYTMLGSYIQNDDYFQLLRKHNGMFTRRRALEGCEYIALHLNGRHVLFNYVDGHAKYEEVTRRVIDAWTRFRDNYDLNPDISDENYRMFKYQAYKKYQKLKRFDYINDEKERLDRINIHIDNDWINERYREVSNEIYKSTGRRPQEYSNYIALQDLLIITPNLALTVHKSQGLTYDVVIVKKNMGGIGSNLNLTYVAVSRAKEDVYIID